MKALWQKSVFKERILNFIFDEGHCIEQWANFWHQYQNLGDLHHIIPDTPFYVVSATLPPSIVINVMDTLHMHPETTVKLINSND